MDSDEHYYCGKVGGVNMKLHDKIKENYERVWIMTSKLKPHKAILI